MNEVMSILEAIEHGDPRAAGQLLPLVYDELRRLADGWLARERPGQTLQATALVHDAYLRLVGPDSPSWHGRGHFFAAAAEAMRRILVENARRREAQRHGGGRRRVALAAIDLPGGPPSEDVLALDEALAKLAAEDPVKAGLVRLRFFGGLSVADAGRVLGVSRATADRYWSYARVWLYSELHKKDSGTLEHDDRSEVSAAPPGLPPSRVSLVGDLGTGPGSGRASRDIAGAGVGPRVRPLPVRGARHPGIGVKA
jgi:RNA polymerase sigma factor (TIGR02999 family)